MVNRLTAFIVFLIFFHCGSAVADEIILVNGDRLTGTVTKMEEGKLTLETEYSDPIIIKTAKIKSIKTDQPVDVHLVDGELLKGTLTAVSEGRVTVEATDERESTVIDWSKVKSINPRPKKWTGSITVSANYQSGNTDETSASIGVRATRRTEQDRVIFRFLYNYGEESGNLTDRNAYGRLKYDYFFRMPLYAYFAVEMENDKFKDLDLRTIVGPGIGYQIWDYPKKSLVLEGGIVYHSENYGEDKDDSWPEARFAIDFNYTLWDTIVFSEDLVVYPRLDEFGEYVLRNDATLSTPLRGLLAGNQWSLKLTHIYEYDSDPAENTGTTDNQLLLGLGYAF